MSQYTMPTLASSDLASAYHSQFNSFKDAVYSNHSGAARPSYIVAGMTWLKIVSGTRHELYYYDGADDLLIIAFNPTANTVESAALNPSGTEALPSHSFSGDTDTGFYNPAANRLGWSTNGTGKGGWDSLGRMRIGDNVAPSGPQIEVRAVADPRVRMEYASADIGSVIMEFRKARGTLASPTTVLTGDVVFQLKAYAETGSPFTLSSQIDNYVEGTVSSGVAPGVIRFATANAAGALTTGMTLNSSQNLSVVGSISAASMAGAMVATQAQQEAASSVINAVTPGRQQFHPSAAKCWLSYNTITSSTIYASYNITSLSDNGVGNTTVNIGVDFSAANQPPLCQSYDNGTGAASLAILAGAVAAGTVTIITVNPTNLVVGDSVFVSMAMYGDQ